MLFQEQSAAVPAMAVKDSKITHLYVCRKLEILDTLEGIFHVISLAHVLDNSCVKPLHKKFQLPDSECVLGFKRY